MCHFVVGCVEEETKRRKKPILKLFLAKPKKEEKERMLKVLIISTFKNLKKEACHSVCSHFVNRHLVNSHFVSGDHVISSREPLLKGNVHYR
jgi:hypothetical protein